MKKNNPLGTKLSILLKNARIESQGKDIGDLDNILSPANDENDTVKRYNQAGLDYYHNERYEEAIEQFKKALFLKPGDAKIHYNLGLTYDTLGHLDEALEKYRKAVQLDPMNADAHNNMGIIYYNNGLYEKAIAQFNKALKIDPNFNLARKNLKLIEEKRKLKEELSSHHPDDL